jgi:asparagine synthase (glutamine-hydrolysing)
MCGFAGFINFNTNSTNEELKASVIKMNKLIQYRGPDDRGEWIDETQGVALGHRRLSIIDLSKEGHQPMSSSSGRYVIVYNGEVYNFEKIRSEFNNDDLYFRGHSDTEVILACIEKYGLNVSLKLFNGMFSFALWDRREKKLFLVRDRLGIKPLYYSISNNSLIFSSELKPIMESGKVKKEIDKESLAQYFKYNRVPAPKTIFENVNKLKPGCILEFSLENKKQSITSYWEAKDVFKCGIEQPFLGNNTQALSELKKIIDDAVGMRMIADVPLGAFLSGGIDSSLVAATMQKLSKQPIQSFSIGFKENQFNEAEHARRVATHLGTNHTEMFVGEREALDIIPSIPTIWDEPFADSSQIPTFLVSNMTKQHVTVALSGDGGDELFGGYERYYITDKLWKRLNKFPYPIRNSFGKLLSNIPNNVIDSMSCFINPFLNKNLKYRNIPSSRIDSISKFLRYKNSSQVYNRIISHWKNTTKLINELKYTDEFINLDEIEGRNLIEKVMGFDLLTYLPDDILTKIDRASMANSLETRVPLLDHRLVEFAWQLPFDYKVNEQGQKWLLKQLLYEYIPKDLIDRPKMGFGIPLASWLRGPLKDWAKDLLSENQLSKHNLLNQDLIRETLDKHLNEEADLDAYLWDVLMFQSWYNEWM